MADDDPENLPLTEDQLLAWRTFLRAHDHLLRGLDADLRESHDMTVSEYDVLVQLAGARGRRLRMRDLAQATLFSPSGLTRLCERLEGQGLLTRERSVDDLRGTDAVLTGAGLARLRAAHRTHQAGIQARFASRFSPAQLAQLQRALEQLTG